MYTLGINAAFHDSAACLISDGRVIAAVEEERLSRIKHAKRPIPFSTYELPFHAINFCLEQAAVSLDDIDHVAYSFDPGILLKGGLPPEIVLPLEPSAGADAREGAWDSLFLASIVNAPRHLRSAVPLRMKRQFGISRPVPGYRWHFVPHHLAHMASAYLCSPFPRAAIATFDGRGERATTSYGTGFAGHMEILGQVELPHSLGLLYEEVTRHLGFLHSSDEYKVMALASFGQDELRGLFAEIISLGPEGQYRINLQPLKEHQASRREPWEPITQIHFNLARSLQNALEETVLALLSWLHGASRESALCLAGGVALNCVMNGRLREESEFEEIWVQPAANDAGTALGAALLVDCNQRGGARSYTMEDARLGPSFSDEQIQRELEIAKLSFRRLHDPAREVAVLLANEKIIGWFQGRAEFGPRALGARSILASPRSTVMQERLNQIKGREEFRPVAPVVLQERITQWFEPGVGSPFMLFVERARSDKLNQIPAAVHVDGSARVQTVSQAVNPELYALIEAFDELTGVPILVNTSFNTRSEPMVCTVQDALRTYFTSPLDALAIGSFLLEKRPE